MLELWRDKLMSIGVSFKHLGKMTDDIGIIQFAKYDIPLKKSGYTVDDNARALLVALNMNTEGRKFAKTYMDFLKSAQRSDGSFVNLKIEDAFFTTIDSEDSIGRAFLACCYALCSGNASDNVKSKAKTVLEKALPAISGFSSLRAIAYSLIGLTFLISNGYTHPDIYKLANDIASQLKKAYSNNETKDWKWFEEYLTYCNAVLPHSLFSYYTISNDRSSLDIAEESLGFLTDSLLKNGYLSIVGNKGWWQKNGSLPDFDQQPVDAASIILACVQGYTATGKKEYISKANISYNWYWGKNIHGLLLYNEKSGGCHDALVYDGLNMNQGAEALVSFLLTYQIMTAMLSENNRISYIPAV